MGIEDTMPAENSELRARARAQLKGKWGQAVLVLIVYGIVDAAAAGLAGIGNLIVGGPMELGLVTYFLLIKRRGSAQMEDLFRGFRSFESALILYIVRLVFIVLWSLLLIVPGVIAALRYSMAMYILHDNPELTGMQALERSKQMMEGRKGKLFGLYLSFIGWAILCIFTLGIGFFWLAPYIKATETNFYEDLKQAQEA
jgi:uncharacterized membrane protein